MKLADGNHFEIVTSSYLSEMLIEFGIICYTDADPVFDESHFFQKFICYRLKMAKTMLKNRVFGHNSTRVVNELILMTQQLFEGPELTGPVTKGILWPRYNRAQSHQHMISLSLLTS